MKVRNTMNKIIPFTNVITLNENFDEIKKIALDDTLKLEEPYLIKGDLIVRGCYKKDEQDEDFSYEMPVEIAIDSKYDTSKCSIAIDDFYYEIVNEQSIRVKIDLILDDLFYKEEKKEVQELSISDERNDYDNYYDEIDYKENEADLLVNDLLNDADVLEAEKINNEVNGNKKVDNNNSNNINTNFNESMKELLADNDKEYSVYRVYVVNETDTLEYIMDKYQVTKEELMLYNDLEKMQVGTKLIIPSIDE